MSTLGLRRSASTWVSHTIARATLRVCSPLRAKAILERVGRWMPLLRNASDAEAAVRFLFPQGSCLTRAVAIAAVLPGAEVVIGIHLPVGDRAHAHAWLEIGGSRVDTDPRPGSSFPSELARLQPTPKRRSSLVAEHLLF